MPTNLKFNSEEIEVLNYERYYYPCPIVQKRLHAVYLKAIFNMPNKAIGLIVDAHRNSVASWIATYQQGGMDALCKVDYGNRQSDLAQHTQSIISSFHQHPPVNIAEAGSRIEAMTGIKRSLTRVRAFIKRQGFGYKKMGHIPAKADSVLQHQWVEQELQPVIKAAQEGKCHLLFADAAHFILQPFICALWCIARIFVKASAGRNRINVLGAVNAITAEVITYINTTYVSTETLILFLKQIKEQYYDKPIVIVLDNARYQRCFAVKVFANSIGIHLLYLPPYSPNLNIIERLWRFTKKKILYAKYYDTPKKFHQAITEFFQTINQNFKTEIQELMTLRFQFFDDISAQNQAA